MSYSTLVFDKISFWWYLGFKGNKRKYNFHCVAMPVLLPQILKSEDFTKTKKLWYLEKEMSFFLQIKKFINYTSRATLWQKNSFVAEVTFKNLRHPRFIHEETHTRLLLHCLDVAKTRTKVPQYIQIRLWCSHTCCIILWKDQYRRVLDCLWFLKAFLLNSISQYI